MSSSFSRWIPAALLIIPVSFVLFPEQANALSSKEIWTTPIQNIVDVMLGPVATAMILISFIGGIYCFMTCGKINGFTRAMIVMNLCGSILLAAKSFINSLFAV